MSLKQKIVGCLSGLAALVAPGCFTGGSIEPIIGVNVPTSQTQGYAEFEPGRLYGIKGNLRTESGVELQVEYSGHNAFYEDTMQINEVDAGNISVGASVPIFNDGAVTIAVTGRLISRAETETEEIIGLPGSVSVDANSLGYSFGIELRGRAGHGEFTGALDIEGYDGQSYEKAGIKTKLGYKLFIGPTKTKSF